MKGYLKAASLLISLLSVIKAQAAGVGEGLLPLAVDTAWGNQAIAFQGVLLPEQAAESLTAATLPFVRYDDAMRDKSVPASHSRPDVALRVIVDKLGDHIASGKTWDAMLALYPCLSSVSLALHALAAHPHNRDMLYNAVLSLSKAANELSPGMGRDGDGFFILSEGMLPAYYEALSQALLGVIA